MSPSCRSDRQPDIRCVDDVTSNCRRKLRRLLDKSETRQRATVFDLSDRRELDRNKPADLSQITVGLDKIAIIFFKQ